MAIEMTSPLTKRNIDPGTRVTGDLCVYPDAKKVAISPLGKVVRFKATDDWNGEV